MDRQMEDEWMDGVWMLVGWMDGCTVGGWMMDEQINLYSPFQDSTFSSEVFIPFFRMFRNVRRVFASPAAEVNEGMTMVPLFSINV